MYRIRKENEDWCVREEESSLAWYAKGSKGEMIEAVKTKRTLKVNKTLDPIQFQKNQRADEENLTDKKMHCRFLKNKDGIDWNRTW